MMDEDDATEKKSSKKIPPKKIVKKPVLTDSIEQLQTRVDSLKKNLQSAESMLITAQNQLQQKDTNEIAHSKKAHNKKKHRSRSVCRDPL